MTVTAPTTPRTAFVRALSPRLVPYPDPVVPAITPKTPWNTLGAHLPMAFAAAWLEAFGGYDYGALTAYLLRAFGYPNIPGGDPFAHSHCWGLASEGGLLLRVECRPLLLSRYMDRMAHERGRMVRALADARVFSIVPVTVAPTPLTPEGVAGLIDAFREPVYVGDLGFDAQGPLSGYDDIGPGADTVRNFGAPSINVVLPPPVVEAASAEAGLVHVADHLTVRNIGRPLV